MKGLEIEIVSKSSSRPLFKKTVFITGGTRGVGKEIALRLAKEGANIVIAGKNDKPTPSRASTIYSVAEEAEVAGGRGLAVYMDIRDESQIKGAVDTAVKKFGGIDILINNASVISLTDTEDTDMKDYDLMGSVNARGTFLLTKTCLTHLKKSNLSHVLCITPPINLSTTWIAGRVPYAIAKYGMSMCVIGMAQEFRGYGISVNALWPRIIIESDDVAASVAKEGCRKPQIMGDAAYAIFTMTPKPIGEFFLDDQALMHIGRTNIDEYCVNPAYNNQLVLNAFIDHSGRESVKKSVESTVLDISKSETATQMQKIIEKFESLFDEELVNSVQKVFQIIVTGSGEKSPKKLYIDLKSGSGSFKMGEAFEAPDVFMTMDEECFYQVFVKGIRPSFAYTNGKIDLQGDKNAVRHLDKVIINSVSKL